MTGYVIGVDGGTESLRAIVFDLAGQPRGSGCARYATRFPGAGRAEQNPEDWWQALGAATREAVAAAGVAPGEILALGLDTTSCSVVALDETLRPVRPALIWMDVRAGEEAADLLATGDPALRINGDGAGPVSAEWMIPKALWLKRHEPKHYARTVRLCEFLDYLNFRLTDRYVASLDNLTMRWHYIPSQGGYPRSLLAALDLTDLLEKWPSDYVRPGEIVGGLTPAAAAHLGLPAGLPVAQGGADAFIGMIGLGVTRPGSDGACHRLLPPPARRDRTGGPPPRAVGRLRGMRLPRLLRLGGRPDLDGVHRQLVPDELRRRPGLRRAEPDARRRSSPARRGCSSWTISRATARPTPTRNPAAPSSA